MNNQYLPINYIRHLTAFYTLLHEHERLRANDISLYMALFQLWNQQRFPVSLSVSRSLIIEFCRIGSHHTYLQCLKRLHESGFLVYEPSEKLFSPSVIKMLPLEEYEPSKPGIIDSRTCNNKDPANVGSGGNSALDTGPISTHFNNKQINNYKNVRQTSTAHAQKKKIDKMEAPKAPELEEVRAWFSAAAQPGKEADQFYFHYKALGWTLSGMPIFDWKAAAQKWIGHIPSLKKNVNANTRTTTFRTSQSGEYKRYDEPI
ncbi:hypothetical protein [Chitinophaga ginsengisoli]|uniref:Uncharacterized protein n=1 Tax=Chitinophaga ginsengisoli TaxID=363837 RepID=A0A2P8GH56_9BACT|nr:hypothetical protein [Chitinophaga ginsengisoli]PSL33275.1 hypothetical protein CLV42_103258 [Chitinophaga ginsengisoli]